MKINDLSSQTDQKPILVDLMIKQFGSIVLLLLLTANLFGYSDTRKRVSLNQDWAFQLGDSLEYIRPAFDDSGWRRLDLPHDWSIEHKPNKNGNGRNAWLPGGIGWYRKTLDIAKEEKDKTIEIQFDGVYRHSTLWVNGTMVGKQYDGYTSFYYDITPYIKAGEPNSIVLRVDNSKQPNCRWYSGSGIYRNVWLTISDELHVKNWGTSITTPVVTRESATIDVVTTIENRGEQAIFKLETIITDTKGTEVARVVDTGTARAYTEQNITQTLKVAQPQRWDIDHPNLYKVISNVIESGHIVDTYESTFGIRTIEFNEHGFLLNGKNQKMKGVCLHHDGGSLGAAVPIQVWERRLTKLKDMGCNAIRTAHNPPAPEFLDLCDQMGFLVMDEFVDKWGEKESTEVIDNPTFYNPQAFGDEYFDLEWKKNYHETIRRDRNHPAVIIWSVGNENYHPGDARQNQGLLEYTSFVRSIDSSRPVLSGMERGKDMNVDDKLNHILESSKYMDLIGMNYGEQWARKLIKARPEKPFVSTESYTYFNSTPEKRFANIERSPWLDVIDNDNNVGLFLWAGIDYLGESNRWPKLGSNSGIFDFAGFETKRVSLYRSFWKSDPMVNIKVYEGDADDFDNASQWGWPSMNEKWNFKEDENLDLVTYTNCEMVRLYVNDELIGEKHLKDFPNKIMKWKNVKYASGKVRAEGFNSGAKVCDFEIRTPSEAAQIKVIPWENKLTDNKVFQAEIYLTDRKGIQVVSDDRELHLQVSGGKILCTANGDMLSPKTLQRTNTQSTSKGKCLVVIQADPDSRQIELLVSGDRLKSKRINYKLK